MVLLEIDRKNVIAVELERYAPRPIDMNRVAGWIEALERMKIEAGKVQLIKGSQSVMSRLCMRVSILPDFPVFQSSASDLLLKLLIMSES
jgi:hypothetical protein